MVTKILQLVNVLAWMTNGVHSCLCRGLHHPQDEFCSAKYVFYGKVTKEKLIPGPPDDVENNLATWEYTFKIIFKMKGVTEGVGQDVVVETRGNGALCGVRFDVGQSRILIGGKKPDGTKTINLCSFRRKIGNLSTYQTFYLFTRGFDSYNFNCRRRCKIGPKSIGCKYHLENTNDKPTICLAQKALCKRERRRCRWVNNETCS
ncbi:metalloproteinase inhibitor 4-like [Mytilus californianus]|uniref:metalloproteinase inhibitor 4-like n=1 Tax=Mytilus californianus TaxID=6549 RepID=UPI002248394F|nr:metalloproteinase inhibitor 4-like [Mytilus californianus]